MASDWEAQAIAEGVAEVKESDPVSTRFRMHEFVSTSKGRGRKRPQRKEVQLVENDTNPGKWVSFHKLKFDELATEIYGPYDPNYYSGADEKLMEAIQWRARRT